jgi:hypothetical protein
VGITRQIGEYCLRPFEGSFGIDHPLDVSHRLQVVMSYN